jgi:hypothetical protein
VESDYHKVESDGPASHRKKDLLDKATKEAEHREKLQDLLTRLSTLNDKVSAEEAALGRLKDKISEADRELGGVRAKLKNHSIRRTNLDLAETSLSLTGQVSMLQKSAAAVAAAPGSKATFIPAVEEEALQAQRLESLINRCIVSHIVSSHLPHLPDSTLVYLRWSVRQSQGTRTNTRLMLEVRCLTSSSRRQTGLSR